MGKTTTVRITTETRDRLLALGEMGDTYDDVIKWLLDVSGEEYNSEIKRLRATEAKIIEEAGRE